MEMSSLTAFTSEAEAGDIGHAAQGTSPERKSILCTHWYDLTLINFHILGENEHSQNMSRKADAEYAKKEKLAECKCTSQ